jgi:glutathionylspermidine synthase
MLLLLLLLPQIAWRLHRMALTAQHECFAGFSIDGVLKKISQSANLWSVMRGSAAENQTPTVTLDFDFCWEVSGGVQQAWWKVAAGP